MKSNNRIHRISKRVNKRILKLLNKQKGGDFVPRYADFSSSGNMGNTINQATYMVTNSIYAMVDTVYALSDLIKLPTDFMSIVDKPNEPLPGNVMVSKIENL